MEQKMKVLLCGDVEGKFNALYSRVENIIKKSGPFDLMLCVGNFFGINNREFEPYKNGTKKVPLSTYILGPNRSDQVALYSLDEYEICPQVFYLGHRGLFTGSGGLKIAYISGCASDNNSNSGYQYTSEDVIALRDICFRGNSNFRGIDILLTSEWPANVTNGDDKFKDRLTINCATHYASWLAVQLKPRYHISGLEGIFYERCPYRTPNFEPDASLDIVTRFIGLGRVGNSNKQKWIHALSLKPIEKMSISELVQKTTDETKCPYDCFELDAKVLNKTRKITTQQYFYDMNSPQEKMGNKKFKKQPIEFDQSKCWFCLASPSVEKHLIITIGNTVYLALAKGGIVDEHFLICSVEHNQCTVGQSADVLEEIQKFKDSIIQFYNRENKVAVFFERNYKTSHMQIQSIPVPKPAEKILLEMFQETAEENGFQLHKLESWNNLDQVIPKGVPYFSLELPSAQVLYTRIQGSKGFPVNYAREVLAMGPILNKMDRIEWRDCILPREKEDMLVKRIRSDYEPYDFKE